MLQESRHDLFFSLPYSSEGCDGSVLTVTVIFKRVDTTSLFWNIFSPKNVVAYTLLLADFLARSSVEMCNGESPRPLFLSYLVIDEIEKTVLYLSIESSVDNAGMRRFCLAAHYQCFTWQSSEHWVLQLEIVSCWPTFISTFPLSCMRNWWSALRCFPAWPTQIPIVVTDQYHQSISMEVLSLRSAARSWKYQPAKSKSVR